MLPILLAGIVVSLALLFQVGTNDGGSVHGPSAAEFARVFTRWLHFVAGTVWVGMLYFFNLVNVNFMKTLDGPTKGKVVPSLLPPALFWFRWGAMVTVLAGLMYFAMYILAPDARTAGLNTWTILFKWLGWVVIAWGLIYAMVQFESGPLNKGPILAICVAAVTILMSAMIIQSLRVTTPWGPAFSNRSLSIALGGGLGVIMLLNVWGIIWRSQKKIIAWTRNNAEKGEAIPAESAVLQRRAFLTSRMNAWLSLPMLFFMAAAHGDYVWWR